MKIQRYLFEQIKKDLGKKKILIIYGPRQVGKTTLASEFISYPNSVYYNCDLDEVKVSFEQANLEKLSSLVKKYDTIIIDEAQRAKGIGIALKILFDNFPAKNYIVTGSSSFDIANMASEPLTGRFFSYTLFQVAELELAKTSNPISLKESLEDRLLYGSYPEVITAPDAETKQKIIRNIASNYLFKDLLAVGGVRDSDTLKKLLQAVALQIGSEASHTELANIAGIDKNTVRKYLEICEKLFIIHSLPPFYSNKRKAISKLKKYYFYDLGVRNALISNFNVLRARSDAGPIWENYIINERMKFNASRGFEPNRYFFKSYQRQEIDLLEDAGGTINGFEFKLSKEKIRKSVADAFREDIGGTNLEIVTMENYSNFIGT